MMERDEIYLIDMWRILKRERVWFASVLLAVMAVTFGMTHVVKRQWKATAWIRIGQVSLPPSGQGPEVEPLLRVIERLKRVPFENEVLESAGYAPDTPVARLYRKSLDLEPMPYAGPLIRMTLRAGTPELARHLAEATVRHLQAVQKPMQALRLEQAHARVQQIRTNLNATRAERDRLSREISVDEKQAGKRGRGMAADPLFATALLSGKNQEVRELKQAENDALDRLSPAYTFDTSMAWPVYVPEKPAFPNAILMWGIGLMAGMSFGVFAAVVRNRTRRPS